MSSTLSWWLGGRRRNGGWRPGTHAGLDYAVYVPSGRRTRRCPVLLLLHGCKQDATEFAEVGRFVALAERHGLLLLAPDQHAHPMRCWRWYDRAHQARDRGEPAALAALVSEVLAEREHWRADPTRVYAVGISAGGAMALTLAATHPDVFAAVGAHSAPPYGSADGALSGVRAMAGRGTMPAPNGPMAPTVAFQGTADTVVHPRNAERVTDQWLAHRPGAPAQRVTTVDGRTTVDRWRDKEGATVLEMWRVDGLGHAWSGGAPEHPYSDPDGPSATAAMWRFLGAHRTRGERGTRRRLRPAS